MGVVVVWCWLVMMFPSSFKMIYLLICSEIQFEEEEGMEEKEEENEEEKEEKKAEVQKEVIGAVWCSVELMLP